MKIFCLLLAFILLTGCAATLNDVQTGLPTYVLTSELSAKDLANKIMYEASKETKKSRFFPSWNPLIATESNGVYNLLVTFTSRGNILLIPYPPQAVAELSIIPQNPNGSKVEFWSINWVDKDRFWTLVKQCASPKTAPESK